MPRSIQLNSRGELTHLLSTEGLPRAIVLDILSHAKDFLDLDQMTVRNADLLAGKSIFNIFFENSTRTRTTFEIARQEAERGRGEPECERLEHLQGGVPARHHRQPGGHAGRYVCCAS